MRKKLLVSLLLFIIISVVGTTSVCAFFLYTNSSSFKVELASEDVLVMQTGSVDPIVDATGNTIYQKEIKVKNLSTVPVFVRVSISEEWEKDQEVLPSNNLSYNYGEVINEPDTYIGTKEWYKSNDGYYYRRLQLESMQESGDIITDFSIKNASSIYSDSTLNLNINAETCQTKNSLWQATFNTINNSLPTPVEDSWNNESTQVVYADNSGASAPELSSNMIPVKWNGSNWIKADSDNVLGQYSWYDYGNKQWANAITVRSNILDTYKNADLGTVVSMSDITAFFVWIPRYKYAIPTENGPRKINIIFENKNSAKSIGTAIDTDYKTHPAFTFGSNELNGIWVGKFETSGTSGDIKIKPNMYSLRNQTTSEQFYEARGMQSVYNIYGFPKNDINTHMMKSVENGAVAYLTESDYGKNGEVWINPANNFYTGCAGSSASSSETSGCIYTYETNNGVQASTTGNIYGIYDLNGGANENLMAVYNKSISQSGFDSSFFNNTSNNKYYDLYTTTDVNTACNGICYGEALSETSSWYFDSATFVNSTYPWNRINGIYSDTTSSGLYAYYHHDGASSENSTFRVVATNVDIMDNESPVVAFDTNGSTTYAKSRSTAVTIRDSDSGVNSSSLKYQWTTSPSAPSEESFSTEFANGQVINTSIGITGEYYLWILAKDNSDNIVITKSDVFHLDNTIPVITMLGSTPVNLNVGSTYTDAGALANDNIDGTITSNIQVTGTVNSNIPGTYTVTYNVSDSSGNAATPVVRTVNVTDTTAPTVAFGTNGNSTYAKSRSTTVTVSDNVAVNSSSLKYQWTTSTTAPAEGTFSATFTNGETIGSPVGVTGAYYLWILAKDTSSNTTIIKSNVFNLDNTIPVITINGSSSLTINQGDTYTDAGATASDNIDGTITSNIQATGTVNSSLSGTYTITYNVSDSSGNAATPVVRTVNVTDSAAPTVAFGTNGNTTYAKSRSTTVTVSDNVAVNTSSLKYQWTTSTSAPAEGTFSTTFTSGGTISSPAGVTGAYYLWILAKDNASTPNTTITKSNVFNLDNTIPVITRSGSTPVNINVGSAYTDAGATASDNIDGNITSSINAISTVNTSVPGTYTVTYNVNDSSGNAATAVVRTVNVTDSTAPTVAFGTNGNSTYAKSRSTTVTVSDNVAVNASSLKYQWTTSTSAPAEGTFSTTFTNGNTISTPAGVTGAYYLWILAKDTSSNTTITKSNVFNLDNTIPVITMLGSTPVNIVVGSTYTDAGATASDNINGNITSSINATSTVNTGVPGTYTVTYNVSDSSGNVATPVVRTVKIVDQTAPVITFEIYGVYTYSKSKSVKVTVSDNVSVVASSLKYQWSTSTTTLPDDSFISAFTSGDTLSSPSDITGAYYLWVIAKDPSGNTSITNFGVLNFDNTIPVITMSGSTPVTVNVGGTYTDAGATASDNIDGDITSSINSTSTVNTSVAGTYTVTYNVSDSCGNAATAVVRTVNVVASGTTKTYLVNTGADDGWTEYAGSTNFYDSYTYLRVGFLASYRNIWVRWTNVDIPKNSTITSAKVQYKAGDTISSQDNTIMYFNKVGNAVAPTSYDDMNSKALTTSSVVWSVPSTTINTWYDSPNISAIIQEIVNGSDWNSGNAMMLLHQRNTDNTTYDRMFNSYESGQANAPKLVITYSAPSDTTAPVITMSGSAPVTIVQYSTYSDAGATASDNVDGNVTSKIQTTSTVNTNVPGTYTVTYNVSDAAGNAAIPAVRTVNVVDFVNPPTWSFGMTPVKWNGTAWVDTTPDDSAWYNYANKQWANVRTADGSMWVWIPRYAYQIASGYHTNSTGTINIKFLNGTTNTTNDGTQIYEDNATNTHYVKHPAFKFGSMELTGIWIAKFEPSVSNQSDPCFTSSSSANCNKSTLTPKITYGVNSWRNINVYNMFVATRKMELNSTYGFPTEAGTLNADGTFTTSGNNVDTHMTKNSEWGAITYLTQSIYGKNADITNNTSSSYYTGGGSGTAYVTNTAQSTTGNVYGIYDISAGAYEYTMSNYNNTVSSSGFPSVSALNSKYVDRYTDTANSGYSTAMYGDAVYETSSASSAANSWYSEYSYPISSSGPWFVRSGGANEYSNSGPFYFYGNNGAVYVGSTWRITMLIATGL